MNIKIHVITSRTHNEYIYHATVEEARTVAEAYWLWHCEGCYDCICGMDSVGTPDTYGTEQWLPTLDEWLDAQTRKGGWQWQLDDNDLDDTEITTYVEEE